MFLFESCSASLNCSCNSLVVVRVSKVVVSPQRLLMAPLYVVGNKTLAEFTDLSFKTFNTLLF